MLAGKLPASFIPVEFASPRPNRVASSTSSSSSTSSHRTAKQPNLVDLLQSNYRYLLSPPRNTASGASLSSRRTSADESEVTVAAAGAAATRPTPIAEQRKVKRKGEAFKSPPLEPAVTTISNAPIGPSSTEPLVYVGTINYQFILSSCQSLSHGGNSNRSHPGTNGNGSSSKNSKKKSSRSKTSGAADSKGKGNDRSTAETSSKQNKVRKSSEEPRPKSTRPSRAASQQRNNPSAPPDTTKRTSPPRKSAAKDTADTAFGMEEAIEKKAANSAKQSSSLVPPPVSSHTNLHHLAPPSPLRQSAVPVRLGNSARGPSQSALTALTRSSSQGSLSSPIDIESSTAASIPRPLKRRRLSVDSSLEKPMDEEQDLSKKLRRALAAESLAADASDRGKRTTTSSVRPSRLSTRYATRSAPNSPPEAAADAFPSTSEALESVSASGTGVAGASLALGRAGRILRRAVSHDVLPEEKEDLLRVQ
ncbi:hypothetical protein QFC21_001855 [Naganishia friedmannii]|uniref:Uncharacterized protein n=1 Tax=Naganishia friedmannii TaxID=89922 RepID=A0ACC2W2F4_9TREE|nr:hypothetical protein QFC21_001855 [Naganishia friedmannii]